MMVMMEMTTRRFVSHVDYLAASSFHEDSLDCELPAAERTGISGMGRLRDGSIDALDRFDEDGARNPRPRHDRIVLHDRSTACAFSGANKRTERPQAPKPVRCQGRRSVGTTPRRFGQVPYRSSKSQAGFLVIHLAIVWLPILLLFGVTLWLRITALNHLKTQRELDRCLYKAIKTQCAFLSDVSKTNLALKTLKHVLAAARTAEITSLAVPILGEIVVLVGEASLAAMRSAAQGLAQLQDAQVKLAELSSLSTLRCGVPLKALASLQIERPFDVEASFAGVPAPLEWKGGVAASEIDLLSWRSFTTRSFGYCASEKRGSDGALNGERYETRFRHAPSKGAKPLSKLSSF